LWKRQTANIKTKPQKKLKMSLPNDDENPSDDMEFLKPQASGCGSTRCGCHATGSLGRLRWVIGIIVLAAAGVLVVRAMIKNPEVPVESSAATFVNPVATQPATEKTGTNRN